jgi:hypothetical protein
MGVEMGVEFQHPDARVTEVIAFEQSGFFCGILHPDGVRQEKLIFYKKILDIRLHGRYIVHIQYTQ